MKSPDSKSKLYTDLSSFVASKTDKGNKLLEAYEEKILDIYSAGLDQKIEEIEEELRIHEKIYTKKLKVYGSKIPEIVKSIIEDTRIKQKEFTDCWNESSKDKNKAQAIKIEINEMISRIFTLLNKIIDDDYFTELAKKLQASLIGSYDKENCLATIENNDGKYHFIDRRGKIINQEEFPQGFEYTSFHDGIGIVRIVSSPQKSKYYYIDKQSKYYYIDKQSKQMFKQKWPDGFEDANEFKNGLARILINEKWYFIDKNGNKMFLDNWPNGFDSANDFRDDRTFIKQNNDKTQCIDEKGRKINHGSWEQGFDNAGSSFVNGLAWVEIGGRYYLMDKNGNQAFKQKWPDGFNELGYFIDGKAKVKINEEKFQIDLNGDRVN